MTEETIAGKVIFPSIPAMFQARMRDNAAFALMLPRISHLALADNWTAVADGPEFGAWNDPASPVLTPAGQAIVHAIHWAITAPSSAPAA